jgi:hypothetical protein
MQSRAARTTAIAAALAAFGAAGFFLFQSERGISIARTSLRTFDGRAREVADALADMRAAQQAYVAAGQGVSFWLPRVTAVHTEMVRSVDDLRAAASSNGARTALMAAAASLNEFAAVDRRARDYLGAGQTLMAGDVVFAEGGETAAAAARQVETARLAEHQEFDSFEAGVRRRQVMALSGSAGFVALITALLAFGQPRKTSAESAFDPKSGASAGGISRGGALMLRDAAGPAKAGHHVQGVPAGTQPRGSVLLLKAAADLCTELGRVQDATDLTGLLGRAADVMDASGIVVWLGSPNGADLRPVLAHGYPEHVLARMPTVPRNADNAAAAAYRSGKLQIVMRRPGTSNGAVVAPLLAPEGCIGALTAEILAGSETTDGVQAMAALIAAQITGVVSGSATNTHAAPAESPSRIASA